MTIYNMELFIDFSKITSKDGYRLDTKNITIALKNKILSSETVQKWMKLAENLTKITVITGVIIIVGSYIFGKLIHYILFSLKYNLYMVNMVSMFGTVLQIRG